MRKLKIFLIVSIMLITACIIFFIGDRGSKAATAYSGKYCGITWSIDTNGVLTLSGSGSGVDANGGVPWKTYKDSIKKVQGSITNSNTIRLWFQNCTNLTSVSLPSFVGGSVTKAGGLFQGCTKLTSVSMPKFKPTGKFTLDYFFDGCTALQTVQLTVLDTTLSDYMVRMFFNCSSLTTFTIGKLSIQSSTNVNGLFCNCSSIKALNLPYMVNSSATSCSQMFEGCSALETLSIPKFNPTKVTDCSYMFYGCTSLTSVDMSGFNPTNLQKMNGMFKNCGKIESIDLGLLNTGTVVNMSAVFYACKALTTLNIGVLDIGSCTSITEAFRDCNSIENIDLSKSGICKVTSLYCTFYDCYKLKYIDATKFDVSEATDLSYCFSGCYVLENLDLSSFVAPKVQSLNCFLGGCKLLKSVDFSKISGDNVTTMKEVFYGCTGLQTINFGTFNPAQVTYYKALFYGCSSLTSLDLSSFDFTKATTMQDLCNGCKSLVSINLGVSSAPNLESLVCAFYMCNNLKSIDLSKFGSCDKLSNISYMFAYCNSLESIYLTNLSLSNVTNFNLPFYGVSKVGTLVIDNANIKSADLFKAIVPESVTMNTVSLKNIKLTGVDSLELALNYADIGSLDMSNADLSCVKNFHGVFLNSNLTSIDLSNANLSGAETMYCMFMECKKLVSLKLPEKEMPNLVNVDSMFSCCEKLPELKYNMIANSIETMDSFVHGCTLLKTIDISSIGLEKATNMGDCFSGCKALTSIIYKEGTICKPEITNNMFANCISLTNVDLTQFDFSNTKTIFNMFKEVVSAEKIKFKDNIFNLPICEDASSVFYYCTSLIELPTIVLSNCKDIKYMLGGCEKLVDVDLSSINTSTIEEASFLFKSCSGLKSFKFENGELFSSCVDFKQMFYGCTSLETLDISRFNTDNAVSFECFVDGCEGLKSITFNKNFTLKNATSVSGMFNKCKSLTYIDLSKLQLKEGTTVERIFDNMGEVTIDVTDKVILEGYKDSFKSNISFPIYTKYNDINGSTITVKTLKDTYRYGSAGSPVLTKPVKSYLDGWYADEGMTSEKVNGVKAGSVGTKYLYGKVYENVSFDIDNNVTLSEGETYIIQPKLNYSQIDLTDKITYTTADSEIISVSNEGKITVNKGGVATVTLSLKDSNGVFLNLDVYIPSFVLKMPISIEVGKNYDITPVIENNNGTNKKSLSVDFSGLTELVRDYDSSTKIPLELISGGLKRTVGSNLLTAYSTESVSFKVQIPSTYTNIKAGSYKSTLTFKVEFN